MSLTSSVHSFSLSIGSKVVLCALVASPAFASSDCNALDPSVLDASQMFPALEEQGAYCLTGSFFGNLKPYSFKWPRMKSYDSALVVFSASNSELNLLGNEISSESVERPGVRTFFPRGSTSETGIASAENQEYAFHSLRITNGKIDLPGTSYNVIQIPRHTLRISLESDLVDRLKPLKRPFTDLTGDAFKEEVARVFQRDGLRHWGNSVDNLEIIGGKTAVKMSGINNAVRDSKIVVTDSLAGAYMFGPGTVIENNIFIFRGMARTESAAPIKLHFGDKAVIRNNIFIIEDAEHAPEQAISLIQSKNVTISGNQLFGKAALVRKYDEQTSTIERDNMVMPLNERPYISETMRAASQVE
ncbi:MAG: hypothetical protein AB8C46_18615 [Burkholderiaceae bacterium]